MIIRPTYLNILKQYLNVKIVKILAGIRRCGKSTLLEMLRDDLMANGVEEKRIVLRKYTSLSFDNLSAKKMYEDLKNSLTMGRCYLLLDEVQEVAGWERVVNSLMEECDVDIYVTGSNSKLMSSEISTYLTGRYVTIPVYTLSFKEYVEFNDVSKTNLNKKELFNKYLKEGGFPLVAISHNLTEQVKYQLIEDIYNSVVVSDITNRHMITNIDFFNRVVKFVIENVGKTFSANSISNYLKSEGRTLNVEVIYNYLEWLEKAFVIYRCKRYDLQGKQVLKTQEKFYLADQSLKYAIFGFNSTSVAATLENIVYFELKRRGYEVYIGKDGSQEIDFVATKRDEKMYVQVCRNLPENSGRETENLLKLKDNYPKLILSLDEFAYGNINGIKIVNLIDFLLEN